MTHDKALELVGRYARLTKQIKDCKRRIGEHLDLCNGISGKRNEMVNGCYANQRETDNKNREIDLHLTEWYRPSVADSGYYMDPDLVWQEITADDHGAKCPHCYAAHLAIQERKAARRSLGAVKAAMARSTA